MKIEQSIMQYAETDGATGYIDIARNLAAVNGKSIAQTKRHDGKYKPLGFMIRVRALIGDVIIDSLNCGYPTRNSVVLAGAARDEMLKSAGVSRSNLESYQKELRILMDGSMTANGSNHYFPGGTDIGTSGSGWGSGLTYDYTKLTIENPDNAEPLTLGLRMLGTQAADSDDWDSDAGFYVVDNWKKFRHSFTPAATDDDIASNVFSWAMQQSSTADAIIQRVEDEQDEKPYDLDEFSTKTVTTRVGTTVGNPTSAVFCAPLGLLKLTTSASAAWEIEVLGVTEL
jgi:hypothetical protein